jgi:hypothetical protein
MCAHEEMAYKREGKKDACADRRRVHAVAVASLITNAFLLLIIYLTDHTPAAWITLRVFTLGLIVFFSCLCLFFLSSSSPSYFTSYLSPTSLAVAADALLSYVLPNAEKGLGRLLAEREATIKALTDALDAKSLYMATMTHGMLFFIAKLSTTPT